ncbi:hypothetical protein QUA82_11950 [Microcoleus sp. F8-D3]
MRTKHLGRNPRHLACKFKSGYITIIPVGAYLQLSQEDIKVDWWWDGRRTPDRDRPRPEPWRHRQHLRWATAIFL